MIILYKEYKHRVDEELRRLADTLNALPGIDLSIDGGQIAFISTGVGVWFKVDTFTNIGLFFLTRCCDRRYWIYGDKWRLEISVGDLYRNKKLPICYYLHSLDKTNIMEQVNSLIDNMNHHLHHKNFMEGYELNIDDFSTMDEVALHRDKQVDKILLT